MPFIIKTVISGLIIALISEIGKRVSWIGGVLASLPLLSILSFVWIYKETQDVEKVVALSKSIFWAVLPSLIFFVAFPLFIKWGFQFYSALVLSIIVMFIAYSIYIYCIGFLGIQV
jgi:uncharacterized membrane protein (GlpM family)